MNINDAIVTLESLISANVPAFLWGAPGVGKSDIAKQICTNIFGDCEDGLNFCDFRAILRDPTDLKGFGMPNRNTGTTEWLRPSDLPFIGNDNFAESGLLFLDELNAASMAMQAVCFGLVLDRKIGQHKLKPGWRILAAGNRMSDKAAAQKMPTALANRFAHVDIEPDAMAWAQWADNNGIEPLMVAFLRFRPNQIHDMATVAGRELRAFPSPRSITQAARAIENITDNNLRLRLVTAICGEAFAAEFEGFARIFASLPSLDSIIANPMGSMVPTEPASLYAVATGIARKSDSKNWPNVLKYVARLPKEFEVTAIQSAVNRDKTLSHSSHYTKWVSANHEVLL